MEEDLETTLVRACGVIRERLGPYPDQLYDCLQDAVQNQDDPDYVQLRLRTLTHYTNIIIELLEGTKCIQSIGSDSIAITSLRHDLNSTLAVLSGYLELLDADKKNSKKYLSAIVKGAAQLKMWLHIDTEEEINMKDIFTQVYHFSKEDLDKREIRFDTFSGQETVYVIPSFTVRRLYQTVRNAMKARVDDTQPYIITMSSSTEGDFCVVEISDHGIGIYPAVIKQAARSAGYTEEQPTLYETLSQIFKPGVSGFKAMNRIGQGYGLNSAALAAEKGGQDVTLETTIRDGETLLTINKEYPHGFVNPSKTTTGTIFRYYLPLAKIGQ